ncbi:MAG: M23 family metallopeptidase [Spirochaetota bacterium]
MKRLLIISAAAFICINILSAIPADAKETFFVDNEYIQEYNGKVGRWIFIPNKQAYQTWSRESGASETELSELNPGIQKHLNCYVFFPFSAEHIQKLADQGIEREILSADEDQFIWPAGEVARISSVLGFRGREFHQGMDIAAPKGVPVRASMEGQVIFEGYSGGYGNVIDLQHRNGFVTRYGHNTAVLVKKGDFVKKGQIIALVGSTGRSTGNHIHFEILCNSIPLDPLDFLPDDSKIQVVHRLKNWKHK